MMATNQNLEAVRKAFQQYYFDHASTIEVPDRIEQREFGYQLFDANYTGMIRHMAFKKPGLLTAAIVKNVPSDMYCSNAYYGFPMLPMQDKDMKGADLIFDIDGKDLESPCIASHTYEVCQACSKGIEKCTCQTKQRLSKVIIPCKQCLSASKAEVKKLMGILKADFGISEKNVHVYFSGNNGFHIHIRDKEFETLSAQARADITGYMLGKNFAIDSIGVRKDEDGLPQVKYPKGGVMFGWRRRVLQKLEVMDTYSTNKLQRMVNKKGIANFTKEVQDHISKMSVVIDPQVTTDVHRIFRMPETLNSKSGLLKARVKGLIDVYDPLADACVLTGEYRINVKARVTVDFALKRSLFSVKAGEVVDLPAFAAVYLICRGLADVKGEEGESYTSELIDINRY